MQSSEARYAPVHNYILVPNYLTVNKIIQTIKDDNGLARMVKSQLGQVKKEKKDNVQFKNWLY